jgi:light-regulated signal transduction histidine kinase (bacteriophytochrome)
LREAQERLAVATAALDAVTQELDAFSYAVSHDLRAPLRHIDGFVRLLQDELAEPSPKAAHYMATIATAARRMGGLIDDLLVLSRVSRQPLDLREVDLAALVQEVVETSGIEQVDRKVQWTVGALPRVMADRALLRGVLERLVSNARKFSRLNPQPRIEIQARPARRGTVEISVRDNGVGFDPRLRDRLFGVFQRLHAEGEFEGGGTGLATSRRILHRHGQRIWAEAEPGRGAVFTFTLTLAPHG